jgi:hypothetical protein
MAAARPPECGYSTNTRKPVTYLIQTPLGKKILKQAINAQPLALTGIDLPAIGVENSRLSFRFSGLSPGRNGGSPTLDCDGKVGLDFPNANRNIARQGHLVLA